MKEFTHEWFLEQARESHQVIETWPESIKKNLVLASASLPTMTPTKAVAGSAGPDSNDATERRKSATKPKEF